MFTRFPVFPSYVRSAILCGSEVLCQVDNEYWNFEDKWIHDESNVWSTARQREKYLGQMLGLNEARDQ